MGAKSFRGLLLLFGLLLLIFRSMNRLTRPIKNNNPFAIIHPKVKYEGQTGRASDGFLSFQSPVFGVRAGFINLFQTYYLQGFTTIAQIFDSDRDYPVYGDAGKGKIYIELVEKFSGIPRNWELTKADIFQVGQAIARVESGSNWVNETDFLRGFKLAIDYLVI